MKEYIKKLLSNSDEISHKRLISTLSFILLVGMIITSFATKRTIESTYIVSVVSLIGGESLLTVIDKFKKE